MTAAPTGRLSVQALDNLPLVRAGDNLVELIAGAVRDAKLALQTGTIVAVAQKIVSKAEGRTIPLESIAPEQRALTLADEVDKDPRLVELILRESTAILRQRPGAIIVRHRLGFVCANAGIDQSNVDQSQGETALLLPEDPDASASHLREGLCSAFGAEVGVMIVDSFNRPWRLGSLGTAIGCAGVPGVLNQRGDADLFGNTLRVTEAAIADSIAAAAGLVMGESTENRPVVLIDGVAGSPAPARSLLRPVEEDLFRD